jgi:(p)ppGpp synthase/HD superfamily hydrolase
MPKPNLYQALHTTIITEEKRSFEIQIRTGEMNELAENGIAAHWKYKDEDPRSLIREDKRLQWLREMVELFREQKNPKEFLKNLKINLIPEEVYVFTPKGRVVSLPNGASALDFAFRIHTEIGLHSAQAKINGKVSPLKTLLKTGDIVEILTSPDKTPSRGWLNFAFTSGARHQLKRWLKQQEKGRTAATGKKALAAGGGELGLPAGALVRPARCCAPIKGEPIIGYVTSGKGVKAHALRCSLIAREILVPERMVDISWDQVAREDFQADLLIRSADKPGLLAEVASAVSKLEGNITKAEVKTFADKKAQTRLCLTIRDIKHLEAIIKDVSSIKDVLTVERI